jgi:hypothetical protein
VRNQSVASDFPTAGDDRKTIIGKSASTNSMMLAQRLRFVGRRTRSSATPL